jgi:phosphohistidine phosphatase
MRTLYLTRHAKSSWADAGMDDFHRPLNDRGERDAPFMARVFLERGEPIDRLVSSPAVRALTTARVFARTLGIAASDISQEKGIYLAPCEMLLRIVNLLNDDWRRVMLFGHNPGFSELAAYISDGDIGDLPTCATVRIDFTVGTWAEVSMGLGTLVWYDYPKRHPELK